MATTSQPQVAQPAVVEPAAESPEAEPLPPPPVPTASTSEEPVEEMGVMQLKKYDSNRKAAEGDAHDRRARLTSAVAPLSVSAKVSKVEGPLDPIEAARVLGFAKEAFAKCAPESGESGNASMAIRFRSSGKGGTSKIRVSGAGNALNRCIAKVLGSMVFPDARKSSTVIATLELRDKFRGLASVGTGQIGGLGSFPSMGTPANRRPSVRIASGGASGAIRSRALRNVLRSKNRQFVQCYERQLKMKPGVRGNATLHLEVKADGRTMKAEVKGVGRYFEQCVARAVRLSRFPVAFPAASSTATYQIVVDPGHTGP